VRYCDDFVLWLASRPPPIRFAYALRRRGPGGVERFPGAAASCSSPEKHLRRRGDHSVPRDAPRSGTELNSGPRRPAASCSECASLAMGLSQRSFRARSASRARVPQCAREWPGEAGADTGCSKPERGAARNGPRSPRAFGFRHVRSASATHARARAAAQSSAIQSVCAPAAAAARAASRGSKPRAAGSCFRRHWGATLGI
jgi:hypothetical protein